MCTTPNMLADGELVACRKCWQCRNNKINDWVGRCIAESRTASASHSITLTYGRDEDGNADHLRAAILTYSDVQKYFKRLRKAGYEFKYFVVGEYGSTKGRAHWHLMIYWKDKVPPHVLEKRFDEPFWPHGVSFWEKPSPASVRYVCKYIQKDMKQSEQQGFLMMSKKPPLGSAYFQQLAEKYCHQGLSPQSLFYSFPDVREADGNKSSFLLTGRSAEMFLEHFLKMWPIYNPGRWYPHSDVVEAYRDKLAKEDRTEFTKLPPVHKSGKPWMAPPGNGQVLFSEQHNCFYAIHEGKRLWWSFNEQRERAWQSVIRTENGPVKPLDGEVYNRAKRGFLG